MGVAVETYRNLLSGGKAYAIQEETSPSLIVSFFEMAKREKERDMIKDRVDAKHERLKIMPGKTMPLEGAQRTEILQIVNEFLRDRFGYLEVRDVAFRIAGTGSLGVKRYVLLTYDDRKDKWRLLDIKESHPSSLAPYLRVPQPPWSSAANRIASVQSMMQYALPRFMGTLTVSGETYVLKQLQPSNQKFDYRLCDGKIKNVETVMVVMAEALASAQLRSASRKGSASVEELMTYAIDKSWTTSLLESAFEYTSVMKKYYLEYARLYVAGKMG